MIIEGTRMMSNKKILLIWMAGNDLLSFNKISSFKANLFVTQ